jgi:hypothetical protein
MYKWFEVNNFRCFKHLPIKDLHRINLIAGKNNVGKTALLEALFLHCGAPNPLITLRLDVLRGIESARGEAGRWIDSLLGSLFAGFDTRRAIRLASQDGAGKGRSMEIEAIRDPAGLADVERALGRALVTLKLPSDAEKAGPEVLRLRYTRTGDETETHYLVSRSDGLTVEPAPPEAAHRTRLLPARLRPNLSEEAEYFGDLEKVGRHAVVLESLQVIEPRLTRLSTVVSAGVPMIHGEIGVGRLVPLPVMGEGTVRLASVILAMGYAEKGVVLVDEIENGLHHSVLANVWNAIGHAAREFNTQVFATTHSWECIRAAHEAFSQTEQYDFRLHRLDRVDDDIDCVTYDQETLDAAIETGLEVR